MTRISKSATFMILSVGLTNGLPLVTKSDIYMAICKKQTYTQPITMFFILFYF